MFSLEFLKHKWPSIALIAAILAVLAIVIYAVDSAKSEANALASNLENGGIGATIGNNVSGFFGSIWTGVKSIFTPKTSGVTAVNS
jgi:hypothetical protein